KRQKVTKEEDSEETNSLDAYISDKDDDDLEGGEDHLVYDVHDFEEKGDEGNYNKEDKEKNNEEEVKDQGKG
ncbi:hypothetical protein KI387_004432, partial [Taxus chinensis]